MRISSSFLAVALTWGMISCPVSLLQAEPTAPPAAAPAADPCAQEKPEEMAKALGITLPHRPWHVVNIWWDFEKPTEHFTSLEMDVTIDRDIPETYNLYVSPVGLCRMNGLDFYGGLQTNINGWASKDNQERVHRGHGAIFSRWSSDKKTRLSLDNVKPEEGSLVESADYEGSFASVRRPFAWTKGTYTYSITKGETVKDGDKAQTWFQCKVRDAAGKEFPVGSLRFEGEDFTLWDKNSAFVEVYATGPNPAPPIPKVNVTFGWPRINGQKAALKKVSAYYPHKEGPAAPDCAWAKPDGEKVRVEVGEIFTRDEAKRRHPVEVKKSDG